MTYQTTADVAQAGLAGTTAALDATFPFFVPDLDGLALDFQAWNLPLGPLTTWTDTILGRSLLAVDTDHAPTVVERVASGAREVNFAGGAYLQGAAFNTTPPYTDILVFTPRSLAASQAFISSISGSPAGGVFGLDTAGSKFQIYSGTVLPSSVSAVVGQRVIAILTHNAAGSTASSSLISINGVEVIGAAGTNARNGFRMGANADLSRYAQMGVERYARVNNFMTSAARADALEALYFDPTTLID